MMAYSEDHIALAAEYALGTLDADERAQVESMMSDDKDFTAVVCAWEQKLGALNQMVGLIEPRAEVWEKIRAAIGMSEAQSPLLLPEMLVAPTLAPEIIRPTVVSDAGNVIQFSDQAQRWRKVSMAMSAIAAVLLGLIVVGISQPDLLPGRSRSKPQTQVAEVKPAVPPALAAQYVALLQKDGGGPAFILTVDGATKNFTVRKIDASAEAGKSYELWLISDKLPKPRSLGVVGEGDFTARAVLASYDASTISDATYAVTVEQAGGSPDGNPHSAPVFTGKLIETVPPAQ